MTTLNTPLDLPTACIAFHCETWDEFDKVVAWLISNGVPLQENDLTIKMNRKKPYVQGEIVDLPVGVSHGWVFGEELRAEYTVFMPHIRRVIR